MEKNYCERCKTLLPSPKTGASYIVCPKCAHENSVLYINEKNVIIKETQKENAMPEVEVIDDLNSLKETFKTLLVGQDLDEIDDRIAEVEGCMKTFTGEMEALVKEYGEKSIAAGEVTKKQLAEGWKKAKIEMEKLQGELAARVKTLEDGLAPFLAITRK